MKRACVLSAIVVISLFLMIGGQSRPALAHNSLEQSDPAAGQMLTAAPAKWTLTFTKDVPLDSASGEVIVADGTRTKLPAPVHGASTKQIVFALPAGLAGSITARWRLVGTDGHVLTARVPFTVNVAAAASTTTAPVAAGTPAATTVDPALSTTTVPAVTAEIADDPVTPEPVRLLLRLLSYAGILAVGGLLFAEIALARGVLSVARAPETLVAGATALTVIPLLQALVFLDDSRGHGIIGSVPRILESFSTTAGSMHMIRFVTGAVMLSGAVSVLRSDAGSAAARFTGPAVNAAAAMHLVALAYVGHSRSMAWPLLGIPADIVHTAAAAVWFGGLLMLVVFVLPAVDPGLQFDAFRRFGRFAGHAVTAIVVTGVIQTLRLHGTILTLFTQTHGRWLLLKLVFVALMLKIGDINRRRLLRRMPHGDAALDARVGMLRRASITELANGAVVMLTTSVLVSSSFD